jgi:hypothetical protein
MPLALRNQKIPIPADILEMLWGNSVVALRQRRGTPREVSIRIETEIERASALGARPPVRFDHAGSSGGLEDTVFRWLSSTSAPRSKFCPVEPWRSH